MTDAYAQAGVRTTVDAPEFASLTDQIRRTFAFRHGPGRPLLDLGYYANVLEFGPIGIAVSMDGVGTKVILAQQVGDYRSIGIDLIAMNVNDLLCVGADPVALLDYIAVESLDSPTLAGLAASLV
ncbi:MAG TPA: AIR synthase related protein, partial [bacterium]|nr:AIR synthase related protein [bacterium]